VSAVLETFAWVNANEIEFALFAITVTFLPLKYVAVVKPHRTVCWPFGGFKFGVSAGFGGLNPFAGRFELKTTVAMLFVIDNSRM